MSQHPANLSLPDSFDGTVRLFPLPNLVLFPGVIQALHIFEPRYRTLVADALAGDGLIAMSLVRPDADMSLDKPEIASTLCVGKIVTHTEFDDGRYTLLLVGARRARIVSELETDKPYRVASIELIDEVNEYAPEDAGDLRQQVTMLFRQLVSELGTVDADVIEQALDQELSLGQLVDLVCYSSNAEPLFQQQVLEMPDACRRAECVLTLLQRQLAKQADQSEQGESEFPPNFSAN